MSSATTNQFSAGPQMLGYLYQCQLALLESIKRLWQFPEMSIGIETRDDIVFEQEGTAIELLQTKHHCEPANLTDSSVDLWKTLRIWSELKKTGEITTSTRLFLVTTATAIGSIASYLKSGQDRDEDQALSALNRIAVTATSLTTETARQTFLTLTESQKKELLSCCIVIDQQCNIGDLDDLLKKVLISACRREHLDSFLDALRGWWYRKIVLSLSNSNGPTLIPAADLEAEITKLRESYRADNLPISNEIQSATLPNESLFHNMVFSKQLKIIDISEKRVAKAALDFYRASMQRSKWLREELLPDDELSDFDSRLHDEWERRFDQMIDELTEDSDGLNKKAAGKKLYIWAENDADELIRSQCSARFVTRGTYQILANQKKVGWHPEYKELIDLNEGVQ